MCSRHFDLPVCLSMARRPAAPLKLAPCPRSLAPTLVALPSMSLIPSAPFIISSRCGRREPTDKKFRSLAGAKLFETRVSAQRVPQRI